MNLYYNTTSQCRVDENNTRIAAKPILHYGACPVWELHFFSGDLSETPSAVDLSDIISWRAAVDSDWNSSTEPMCRTLAVDIDSSQAESGIISVPVNANTARYLAVVDGKQSVGGWFELRGFDDQGNVALVVLLNITCNNSIDPTGGAEPEPVDNDTATMTWVRAVIAQQLYYEYSADGTTWHDPPMVSGTDVYFRIRHGENGTPSEAQLIPYGPAGTGIGLRGEWSNSATYEPDEMVTYNGSAYISVRQNTNVVPGTSSADWELYISKGADGTNGPAGTDGAAAGFGTPTASVTTLSAGSSATAAVTASGTNTEKIFAFSFGIPAGADGQDGADGTGVTVKGAYDSSVTYEKTAESMDAVQYNGSLWGYINSTASSGNAPPSDGSTSNAYWTLLVAKGTDGTNGTNGTDGAAAGFGTPTASATTLSAGSSATAAVTASGTNTEKVFAFSFGIPAGADGTSSYTYVAYASDASGTGFSLTPSDSLQYRAEIHTSSPISTPTAADFSGAVWVKYIGDDGTLVSSRMTFSSVSSSNLAVFSTGLVPVGVKTSAGNYYLVEKASVTLGSGSFTLDVSPYLAYDNAASFSGTWTVYLSAGTGGDQTPGVPPGTVIAFTGPAANLPTGYLLCNGAAVSRTDYAALFTAVGTTYGAGDASTTFNLPDFRGKFLRGYLDGTSEALGTAQGDAARRLFGAAYKLVGPYAEATYDTTVGAINLKHSQYGHFYNANDENRGLLDLTFDTDYLASGGTYPTAPENRPVNYAVNWIIKY